MDSVLHQTMKELEIIVVDDGSTDGTVDKITSIMEVYPDRICLIKQENAGPAAARNRGIKEATGEYITFLDSDDYIEYDAYEKMYARAKEMDSEMVCAPFYLKHGYFCEVAGKCEETEAREVFLTDVRLNLYNRIIKKSLIERVGISLPDFPIGEDVAFIVPLMTWAKNLSYLDYPYYYYEMSENSISTDDHDRPWVVDNAEAVRAFMVEHANPEDIDAVRIILAKRLYYLFNHNRNYQEQLWNYVKEHEEFFLHAYKDDSRFEIYHRQMMQILQRTQEVIPQRIFVNGFVAYEGLQERIDWLQQNLFVTPCEVVVLDEKNCDTNVCDIIKTAYELGDVAFLGKYFAMKAIEEQGGIYISHGLQIKNKWNTVLTNNSFFADETAYRLSEDVFGGNKGNVCMQRMLYLLEKATYSEDIFQSVLSLVLKHEYGVPEKNQTSRRHEDICVYNSGVFVFPEPNEVSLSVCVETHDGFVEGLYLEKSRFVNNEVKRLENEKKQLNDKWKETDGLRKEAKQEAASERKEKESVQKELRDTKREFEKTEKKYQKQIEEQKKRFGEEKQLLTQQRDSLDYELNCVRNSASYKIGRVITFVPRKTKTAFRYMKQHGLKETWKFVMKKLSGK